jgi:hypothetical protein
MTSGGIHGVLIGSRVFLLPRCTMLEKVPGDVASRCWPYLVANSSHVGVDVDGPAYPLHLPTACIRQTWGQGLDICGCIDRLDTCGKKFYTERIAFTRICLPYDGIITVCMHVSLVELPFQIVMGQILALECMLSGARGLLQPCPISSGSDCFRPPEFLMLDVLIQ